MLEFGSEGMFEYGIDAFYMLFCNALALAVFIEVFGVVSDFDNCVMTFYNIGLNLIAKRSVSNKLLINK